MVTQGPDSGEEKTVHSSEFTVLPKAGPGSGSWEIPEGREGKDDPYSLYFLLIQKPQRSPSPDLNTCATRSSRFSCSRSLLCQSPPSERDGRGAKAAPCRTSFPKAKLNEPETAPPPLPCILGASELQLPKETTFQASVASPTPAASGKKPGTRGTQRL